ncbi:MAG: hypothetical protein R6U01_07205 [Halorubrum sp.]|uniref:imidazolonepropionase-like domain-containing protein n=1 Tax=Halorubrum sp. TaxID=1879286 RepID=UPI003970A81E
MLIAGTVIADPETVVPDGAVVVEGTTIAAVGESDALRDEYPDHERRELDLVAPGLVGGHVHSVQSLGRGIADDAALLDWLFDAVLPMEAAMDAEATRAAGFDRLGTLREGQRADVIGLTTDRTRATPVHDPRSHLVYAAHGDDVVFAVVDGRVRYDGGEHVGIDADAVRERATREAKRVVEEAGIDTAES